MLRSVAAILLGLPAVLAQNNTCVRPSPHKSQLDLPLVFCSDANIKLSAKLSKTLALQTFSIRIRLLMRTALSPTGPSARSSPRTALYNQNAPRM